MTDEDAGTTSRGGGSGFRGLDALRIGVALLLAIHGIARIRLGIVDDFGRFLADAAFAGGGVGLVLAWTVTLVEIAGGAALAVGRAVRPLCLWFAGQLALGIVLVHASQGWFVVGAGRNGMEYSALMILVLLVVAWESRAGDAGG